MNEHNTFSIYFEEAMKIHAICADRNYSEEQARIFTYMHAKAVESGQGIDYFNSPAPEDCEALEIMLGQKRALLIPSVITLDDKEQDAVELILSIAEKIANLDKFLARECGLENRLSGELRSRLKLYKCKEYREEMTNIYSNEIEPELKKYDRRRIDKAFKRHQREKDRLEQELMALAGL